jgi:hypothetical protein
MKKILILLLALTLQQTFAQEQTLLSSSGEYSNGGFGAPVLKYTTLNDQGSLIVGGRGGWIINHSLIIGGGFYGLASQVSVDVTDGDIILKDADKLHLMYGGFEVEYIFSPLSMLHVSVYTLLGMGNVSYRYINQENFDNNLDTYHMDGSFEGDQFFIAEPAINVELNVTTFFHLALGASYRFTSGAEYQTITDSNISGFNGMLTFKFGKF